MKKILSATLVVMLSVTAVYAEPNTKYKDLKFGVKIKPHFAKLCEVKAYSKWTTSIFRPSFSFFGEYAFSNAIKAQVALEYSGQGKMSFKAWRSNFTTEQEKYRHYNYIMLTATQRFYPRENQKLCLFIGPRVGWLVSHGWKAWYYNEDGKQQKKETGDLDKSYKKNLKRFNWGILLGLDYEFDNGILIGYERNIGLTSVTERFPKEFTFSEGFTLGYNLAKIF